MMNDDDFPQDEWQRKIIRSIRNLSYPGLIDALDSQRTKDSDVSNLTLGSIH
jgi:hypothetical protein